MTNRARGAFWVFLLLQVPENPLAGPILVALHRWAGLPAGCAVGAFVVCVGKDLALCPVEAEPPGAGRDKEILS
jgi:hypothetical protein